MLVECVRHAFNVHIDVDLNLYVHVVVVYRNILFHIVMNNEVIINVNEAINNHVNLLFLNNQAHKTRNDKKLTYACIYDLYVSR